MIKKIFIGGLVLLCVLAGIFLYNEKNYVGERVEPLTYFDEFANNTNNLVFEDKRIDLVEPVLIKDGQLFMRYEVASQYVSDTIFYDEVEKVLTLTNDREVIRLYEGENRITYGDVTGCYILLTTENGLYLSSNLLEELFAITIHEGRKGTLFVATDQRQQQEVAQIKKKTSLRTHPQEKSVVVEELSKDSKVYLYEETEGFLRVRSEEGIVGYIESGKIKNRSIEEAQALPLIKEWESNPLKDTVRLVWDQMTTQVKVDWTRGKYQSLSQVNVIAPTWFEFQDAEGNLKDRGTVSYVQQAHQRGIEVWPILSHNFEETALTHQLLTSTEKRQYMIDQIIDLAKLYGFDGINIDIENVQSDTSAAWVQFMRELYPQLKKEGLKVSVDVYVPSGWSEHYERQKVARSCDYFIVMGYDQHWSGSQEAGSVAEIPWVEAGIQASLEEVPAEKLVLGIPFYTRLWLENSQGLQTKSYGMASIQQMIQKWGVEPIVDEKSGQHYVECLQEEGLYKIWLEDAYSIAKRVALIEEYHLAGYAAWKLGLETSDIWDVLNKLP